MILVTVGSTHFENLIKEADDLALKEKLKIRCQIGSGKYLPFNCDYYKYSSSFSEDLKNSQLVITHGGATVYQCITLGKPFIAISNTALADDHQTKQLKHLSKYFDFPWSDNPRDIHMLYNKISSYSFKKSPSIDYDLTSFIIHELTK